MMSTLASVTGSPWCSKGVDICIGMKYHQWWPLCTQIKTDYGSNALSTAAHMSP